MIVTPPFARCPMCAYSLRGLPEAHRCPECGLPYDPQTILFQARKPWKLYLGLLGLGAVLVLFVAPNLSILLVGMVGPVAATLLITTMAAIILVASAVRRYRTNRAGRFVAVTPFGIAVRNMGVSAFISWDELSMLSVRDIRPWVKPRGNHPEIPLIGLFDNKAEMYAFEAAAHARQQAHATRGEVTRALVPLAAPNIEQVVADAFARVGSKRLRGLFASRTTMIGCALAACGVLYTLLHMLFAQSTGPMPIAGVVLFWAGAAVYLVGAWRADVHRPR